MRKVTKIYLNININIPKITQAEKIYTLTIVQKLELKIVQKLELTNSASTLCK